MATTLGPAQEAGSRTDPAPVRAGPLELCFRYRSALLLLLVPPIVVGALGRAPLVAAEVVAGVALVVAGVALRVWAARSIGKRARVRDAGAQTLITAGPYGRVRNPLYLGNGAVLVGLGALGGGASVGLGLLLGVAVVYGLVVRHEETQLKRALGAPYEDYLTAVPRWCPWPGRAAPLDPEASPHPWGEVARRERSLLWVPFAVAAVAATRTGSLPLEAALRTLLDPVGLPPIAGVVASFGIAALATIVSTEAKLRRHRRARAALAAAEGAPPA